MPCCWNKKVKTKHILFESFCLSQGLFCSKSKSRKSTLTPIFHGLAQLDLAVLKPCLRENLVKILGIFFSLQFGDKWRGDVALDIIWSTGDKVFPNLLQGGPIDVKEEEVFLHTLSSFCSEATLWILETAIHNHFEKFILPLSKTRTQPLEILGSAPKTRRQMVGGQNILKTFSGGNVTSFSFISL